ENKLELMNGARGLQLLYRPSALWRMCSMPRPAFDGTWLENCWLLLASISASHQHHIHCRPRAIVGRMYVKLHLSEILIANRRIQLFPVSWQDRRLVAAQLPAPIPFTSHRFVRFTDTLPRFSVQACGSSYVARQPDLLASL